jgi:hypothetical protein
MYCYIVLSKRTKYGDNNNHNNNIVHATVEDIVSVALYRMRTVINNISVGIHQMHIVLVDRTET